MSRVQFRHSFREVALVLGILAAAVSHAGAQTALVEELSSFKPPYQIVPAAITQLPDGRIYGFYRGGLFGAIYKVTPNGSGGYVTTVVYEFGPGQAGPADGFMVNATEASVVVAAPDGWIYYAGKALSRFNPDTLIVEDLHPFDGGNSQATQLSMGIDGHTLFGAQRDGRIYSYDTATATYRNITTLVAPDVRGVLQMKDGNLIAITNDINSPFNAIKHRIDPATGVETAAIVDPRALAYPPMKGDDGEIYTHTNVFGDRYTQRIDVSCFCAETLQMVPYQAPWMTTFTGVRNGYIYYNGDSQPHRLNVSVDPPVLEKLTTLQSYYYQVLNDGTLAVFASDDKIYAINTSTAARDNTPTPLLTEATTNDGIDGFPADYTEAPDGMLYGISENSRTQYGSIFRIDPNTKSRALVKQVDFGPEALLGYYGTYTTKMVLAGDGALYGTYSVYGGTSAIFRFTPATNVFDVVRLFPMDPNTYLPGPDGGATQRLTVGSDGWLYGINAQSDDPNYLGSVIFKIDPASGTFAKLFTTSDPNGAYLYGQMKESSPGIWLGDYSTYDPNSESCSWMFRFDASSAAFSILRSFMSDVDGCGSHIPLVRGADGRLYGRMEFGGTPIINGDYNTRGHGNIFAIDPESGVTTKIVQFAYDSEGSFLAGDLIAGADGFLYSGFMTRQPDYKYEKGLLRVDPKTGAAITVARLPVLNGYLGESGFFAGSDGRIFVGTTSPWFAYGIGVLDAIPVAPASGPFGGSTSVTATLSALGVPLAGRTIAFTLNGQSIGSAMTNAQGVAAIDNISLAGIVIGSFPAAIGASFAGDEHFPAASGSGALTVLDVPTPGLMIGNGVIRDGDDKYNFEFVVRERANGDDRGTFELRRKIKKSKGADDRFVAREFTNVVFSDDPSIRPGRRPRPQIDTVQFSGPGTWNGQAGYRFEALAQDSGEPGRHRESLRVTIYDSANHVVLTFDQVVDGGNIESGRLHR